MANLATPKNFLFAVVAVTALAVAPAQVNAQMERGPTVTAKPGASAPPRATMERKVGFKKAAVSKPQDNIKPDANMFRQDAAKIVNDKRALDRAVELAIQKFKELGQAHQLYADAYHACTSKTYTPQEQKQAGCTKSDDYQACVVKLIKHCSRQPSEYLKQEAEIAMRHHERLGKFLMRYGMNSAGK